MNRLSRVAVLFTVALGVLAGGGLLSAGVAHAQAPSNLGTLSFDPATGTDKSAIKVRTSGGCTPAGSTAYDVRVTGPNNFDFVVVAPTSASFSKTGPFTVPFGQTMLDAGALQDPPVPLVANTYNVTLNCRRGFPPAVFGTYTGVLIFTSPTAYKTDAPVTATTAPLDGDGSALPPAAQQPPAGTPSLAGPPSDAAQDPSAPVPTAQPTGQGVHWLVLAGAVLGFLVVVAVATRIWKRLSA